MKNMFPLFWIFASLLAVKATDEAVQPEQGICRAGEDTGGCTLASASASTASVKNVQHVGPEPFPTPDPFLFCVYHKDLYPEGNARMEVPGRTGNGQDFDPHAPYRMYHGRKIPGFPQHPHRGFETMTATMEGIIDHTDSLGYGGRFGQGDLQWMTAGAGIVHGENFPLLHNSKPNPLRFFQIWLNLPAKSKMVKPDFVMHWSSDIDIWNSESEDARVVIWAGSFNGKRGRTPPKNSWATDPKSDVGVLFIQLKKSGSVELPPCQTSETNRWLYLVEGSKLRVGNRVIERQSRAAVIEVHSHVPVTISCVGVTPCDILVLQGRPIGEPVASHGPFVMNTREEIAQTFQEFEKTQFGGWPWDEQAVVFPRSKGRFALIDGKETSPPDNSII